MLTPDALDRFGATLATLREANRNLTPTTKEKHDRHNARNRARRPGPPEALTIRVIPIPVPIAGWVLVRVKAFGLNRSELHPPRPRRRRDIPEGAGHRGRRRSGELPRRELTEGRQVAAMMGGMGRTFDGGYAEYTCVPVSQVVPFSSELDWSTVGAVPEMLQTSYGSLTVGLDAKSGQSC
ncbi:hypothetical protein ACETU7_08720 [Rhodococcus sp. 3Y1]